MGLGYAQYLCIKHNIPMIPIHHMEAHALTARLIEKVSAWYMYTRSRLP
jgi:N6-L-threonylcarbamoyladenine synthase